MPSTRLINQSEVLAALDMREALTAVEEAFRLHGLGKVQMPSKVYLNLPLGDLRAMPSYAPALGFASIKNINAHPGNRNTPSIVGTLTLFDPDSGFPLAIMDATAITRLRTGAASGIATRLLARADAKVLALVGAGSQALTQLEAILAARAGIEHVLVYDLDGQRAAGFARTAADRFGVLAQVARTIEEAVKTADVVTTITPARAPIVLREWIKPGTHINAIGADAEGKQELSALLVKAARVVVDDMEQATHSGEVNVALHDGVITRTHIYAELGEIVAGLKKGRERAEDITLFDSTGLALQDLACAAHVYRRVIGSAGTQFDFLA